MKSVKRLAVVLTTALASAGCVGIVVASPASADIPISTAITNDPNASNGFLTFYDASGNVLTSGNSLSKLFTFAAASTAGRPNTTKATVYFAFPDHNQPDSVNWNSDQVTASTTFPNSTYPPPLTGPGFTKPVAKAANAGDADLGSLLPVSTQDHTTGYDGILQIRLYDSGPGVSQQTKFWATDIHYDQGAGTWQQVFPAPTGTQTTTTSLAASPAGHTTPGSNVTLTATLTPDTAAGTVQFKDGANNLGSPVAVSGGSAVLNTSALTKGTHSLTAVFTPTDNTAFTASTSSALSYTVGADATVLTIGKSTKVAFGKTAKVSTKLTDKTSHTAISGATVTLLSRTNPKKPFGTVKSATTNGAGVASLTVQPKGKTYYEWKYAGTSAHAAKTSAIQTVSVSQVVTALAKPTRPKHGTTFTVYGTVAPSKGNLTESLQAKVGRKFKTIDTAKTKRQKLPNGKTAIGFVFKVNETKKGTYTFRVSSASTSTLSGGTSKTLTVHVH